MQHIDEECFTQMLRGASGVLVTVVTIEGSTPREQGAWMGVFPESVIGTVGGGHVELQAIEAARAAIGTTATFSRRYALGPSLGQCCGGVMHLRFEPVTR